jgi:hypothetical protein
VIGSSILREDELSDKSDAMSRLKEEVTEYLLKKEGFLVTEGVSVDKLSKRSDSADVMEVQIARVTGLHEKWGLERTFLSRSIFAHRFEDGAVFEHSLISYGGYVSRTYYVVGGNEFRAFAQRNFRKPSD